MEIETSNNNSISNNNNNRNNSEKSNVLKVRKIQHPILSGIRVQSDWCWDSKSKSECVTLSSDFKRAFFFDNPYTISRGTAAVRGTRPVLSGIHYFEIVAKEPLYGTAVMIGYGTDEVQLHYENFDYVNLIGKDSNSWGLCHKGSVWHMGSYKYFCDPFFEKETVVGVLLNMYNKTLHYFINGKYMGIAFRNVNPEGKRIYPMISSTATDIELELKNPMSIIYSLQDLCCQEICKNCKNFEELPLSKRIINYLKTYPV